MVIGAGVDWLTMTVSQPLAEILVAQTQFDDAGKSRPGFEASELRTCEGGQCWRRFMPRQSARLWGMEYESWEWSGPVAHTAAINLAAHNVADCRPTRLDNNIDIKVPEDFTPDHLVEMIRPHVERQGLKIGIVGEDDINTRYVGSKSSERRIRIYRKDLEDVQWATFYGPTLRVELVLKGDHAAAMWLPWCEGKGQAVAAAHIEAMTGLRLLDEVGQVPQIIKPEGGDIAEAVVQLVKQYGPKIAALHRAGVPIIELCEEHAAGANRMGQSRMRKIAAAVAQAGPDTVAAIARELLSAAGRKALDS